MSQRPILGLCLLVLAACWAVGGATSAESKINQFKGKGTIQKIKPDEKTILIHHEAITNYMEAMTMPFRVKTTNELAGLRPGDVVTFRLSVTESESWIDQISRVHAVTNVAPSGLAPTEAGTPTAPPVNVVEGLGAYTFINEFGRPVNFRDFRGQAIALTFFFTACPIPDYCPRLTKNFLAATRKLESLPNAPTNWHLFSISFDTERDTPEVLRAYARGYGYNSNRWTFLTGSQQTIAAVARNFGFSFKKDGASFSHEFLTVVLDAQGHWQAGWPIGGDTSDTLVQELVKAAAVKNESR